MTELTETQIKLAEQLLISVIKKEPYVTYSELAERIDPPIHHRNVGKNIGQVSRLCYELGLPLLSAKVINKYSHNVGEGFFGLCQQLGVKTEGVSENELYKQEREKIRQCKEWYILAEYLHLKLDFEKPYIEIYPDEISADDINALIEGASKRVNVNVYERNSEARRICIKKHGCKCTVCGIDFEETYGELGKGFIHIHHIVPLHEIKKDYVVNGEKDLIPVCPNCHAMLHRKVSGRCLTIVELKCAVRKKV